MILYKFQQFVFGQETIHFHFLQDPKIGCPEFQITFLSTLSQFLTSLSSRHFMFPPFTRSGLQMFLQCVRFSSVTQLCQTLCDPMNCSTPSLPVHHQLLEFTQIHVHRVGDAIQPSHPLSSPSPPAPNPSQHQSLFQ